MKIRGSDGSKSEPAVTGRLKGPEETAVKGCTVDQKITTIARVLKSKLN
jgi:hypothetical protein